MYASSNECMILLLLMITTMMMCCFSLSFQLVKLQTTHYKNAAAQMESMLPSIEKRMSESYHFSHPPLPPTFPPYPPLPLTYLSLSPILPSRPFFPLTHLSLSSLLPSLPLSHPSFPLTHFSLSPISLSLSPTPPSPTSQSLLTDDTKERPMFGCPLEEHLRLFKTDVSIVLKACCQALRDQWMDTEGLFRIASGMARVRLLKVPPLALCLSTCTLYSVSIVKRIRNVYVCVCVYSGTSEQWTH